MPAQRAFGEFIIRSPSRVNRILYRYVSQSSGQRQASVPLREIRLLATFHRHAVIESNSQESPSAIGIVFQKPHRSAKKVKKMNILITGASGMIGSALSTRLTQSGHQVFCLSRSDSSAPFHYDPINDRVHISTDTKLDVVVNLAGANIADKRWNIQRKEEILNSRARLTRALSLALSESQPPPHTLLSASAIGFYGNQCTAPADEDYPPGDDFLAEVSVRWEEATAPATNAGIRTVLLRFGLVLNANGGVLKNLVMPGGLAVVGRLGDGEHLMSWISLPDAINVMMACLQDRNFNGPVNVVAPEVVSNRAFAKALSKARRRPALPPIPAAIVRMMFGEMADTALLASGNICSSRLDELGIELRHKDLDSALSHCFSH